MRFKRLRTGIKSIILIGWLCLPMHFIHSSSLEEREDFSTLRLIIKTKEEVDLGSEIVEDAYSFSEDIHVLEFQTIEETKETYEKLKQHPLVDYVEPDREIEFNEVKSTLVSNQNEEFWGIQRLEINRFLHSLVAEEVEHQVTVAVIDTGIDEFHPIFESRLLTTGYNFVNEDHPPYDDSYNGHGTHVAGVIAKATEGLEQIKILPIKTLDSRGNGTILNVGKSIQFAMESNVDIINLSLGLHPYVHSEFLESLIQEAIDAGITVVIAAGNDNIDTSDGCPAHLEEAIIVSAIDEKNKKAYFSNYGTSVDVTAPGVNIYSATPGGGYGYLSGTSMAAPHVTAIAALLKLQDPSISPDEIEQKIKQISIDIGRVGWDQYFGFGIPNLSLALPEFPLDYLLIDKQSLVVEIGDRVPLQLFYHSSYLVDEQQIHWETTDADVAVIESGELVARKAGEVTVSVTFQGYTVTCEVMIQSNKSDSLDLDEKENLEVFDEVILPEKQENEEVGIIRDPNPVKGEPQVPEMIEQPNEDELKGPDSLEDIQLDDSTGKQENEIGNIIENPDQAKEEPQVPDMIEQPNKDELKSADEVDHSIRSKNEERSTKVGQQSEELSTRVQIQSIKHQRQMPSLVTRVVEEESQNDESVSESNTVDVAEGEGLTEAHDLQINQNHVQSLLIKSKLVLIVAILGVIVIIAYRFKRKYR